MTGKSRAGRVARGVIAFALGLVALAAGCASLRGDWRTASHEPVGTAPDPKTVREAVVQVYSARTFGWRGIFGVHTWVAVKPANAEAYTVYEVIGWRLRYLDSVVAIHERPADARWYGAEPELLADRRGPAAEALIPRIDAAARVIQAVKVLEFGPGQTVYSFAHG